jgi:molybdopterin converting factor small subunit
METMTVRVHSILEIKRVIGRGEIDLPIPARFGVRDLVDWMVDRWGNALSSRLIEPGSGRLHPSIRVMVNGRDIAFLQGEDTPLREGDEILFLEPVAGG